MNRRRFLLVAGAGWLALGSLGTLRAQATRPLVTVYKSPTCGCCGEWEKHMVDNGFRVEPRIEKNISYIKRKYRVPYDLLSCHTAEVGGYAVEGHVPAADVKRLLRERPKAAGIAVPGMPIGSPGMEQGKPEPYDTIAFAVDGKTWLFERH
jgi:hypothetical protein